ncbi:unnamed protein product [Tetraodon nigroviridis]|uniref:(spotted green pufferfish) hypothetical protein n=1 Tax=Tetraodon nigroviridis TaxID=99883 RepID=Q4S0W6_TETNG|nr:unnamed protein product [Tetraodon nigroviridis]
MASNACHIVEAALKQMDEMIAGKKGTTLFSDVMQSRVTNEQTPQSCSQSTDPRYMDPALKALQLTEALKALLEGWGSDREQESVRKQVATDTADVIPEVAANRRAVAKLLPNISESSAEQWACRMEYDIDFHKHFGWLRKVRCVHFSTFVHLMGMMWGRGELQNVHACVISYTDTTCWEANVQTCHKCPMRTIIKTSSAPPWGSY